MHGGSWQPLVLLLFLPLFIYLVIQSVLKKDEQCAVWQFFDIGRPFAEGDTIPSRIYFI